MFLAVGLRKLPRLMIFFSMHTCRSGSTCHCHGSGSHHLPSQVCLAYLKSIPFILKSSDWCIVRVVSWRSIQQNNTFELFCLHFVLLCSWEQITLQQNARVRLWQGDAVMQRVLYPSYIIFGDFSFPVTCMSSINLKQNTICPGVWNLPTQCFAL